MKIRPKQDMHYELQQTFAYATIKKLLLLKPYGVQHFKDLPKEIQEKHIVEYLFLENTRLFLQVLVNITTLDPSIKKDMWQLRKSAELLFRSMDEPDFKPGPEWFKGEATPPKKFPKKEKFSKHKDIL